MSYRNVVYDRKKSVIHHYLWDDQGNPTEKQVYFEPYIYLPSADKTKFHATGIDGMPLIKKSFKNEWERQKYVKDYKGKIYFDLPATQQYLLENYYSWDIQELTRHPLRIYYFDIEVIADEFPDAKQAKYPINCVTIYDTIRKKYFVWGVKPYDHWSAADHLKDIGPEDIVYEYCISETALLKKFLRFWRADFPDLIVGWNSSTFDIPYIVNRFNTVFGDDKANQLSPVDNVYGKEVVHQRFKTVYTEYTIDGVSHLDYMFLYKYFTPGERESDALDFVCYSEIKMGKLDYGSMSLHDLYHKDWNRFINYNIWDVHLMVMLDAQKKYIDIARFSACYGFCNINKAMGKTAIITGVLAKESMQKGKIIPTQTNGLKENIPGGHVKQPKEGMYEYVVSFDADSLYPSTIITLNISPETKIAKVMKTENDICTIFSFKTKTFFQHPKSGIKQLARDNGWALSASGVFFTQHEKSVAADFVDTLYAKRKKVKAEGIRKLQSLDNMVKDSVEYNATKQLASQLDTEQYLYKILLNSTYGAFANSHFALYDIDCAKAITTTGQSMIKQTEKIVNDYVSKEWNLSNVDCVAAMDTDSVAGESTIRTNIGTMPIEQLFDVYDPSKVFLFKEHEAIDVSDSLLVAAYDQKANAVKMDKAKYLIRHKVTKKRYKIKCKGKEIIVTEDHSCMVIRDGALLTVKPHEMLLTDQLVTIQAGVHSDK